MELKFVIPNMEKTFGNLEFAGEDKVVKQSLVPGTRIKKGQVCALTLDL